MGITRIALSSIKTLNKSDSFLDGNPSFIPTFYDSISTITVGSGGATSVTFSSIPQTYTHLQIRGFITDAATGQNFYMVFNDNAGTKGHRLFGDGSAASSDYYNAAPVVTAASNTGNMGFVTDLLDYKNTNKTRVIRTLGGGDNNGSGRAGMWGGFWYSTAAITKLQITATADTIPQYSHFALYGIKG
jgi:hypothetical protein